VTDLVLVLREADSFRARAWATLASAVGTANGIHGLAPLMLAALLGTCVAALLDGENGRWWAIALLPQGLAWPLLNKQLEGPLVVAVTVGGRAHGVTVTDLFAPLALAVAGWRLLRRSE